MAIPIVAAVILGNIVGQTAAPADVETDVTASTFGTLNVHINAVGAQGGYLVVPATATLLATLADGPCTIIISQGPGALPAITTTQ